MNAGPGPRARRSAATSSRSAPARAGVPHGGIALALAGGGPLGGIYEIGALAALDEALEGIDFNALDIYVGVSAGGFVAAGLANGITPAQMVRKLIDSRGDPGLVALRPEALLRPAFAEYRRRAASVPGLLAQSLRHYLGDPLRGNLVESFQRLGRAIPTGLFDSAGIDAFLKDLFARHGRSNDFRNLRARLFLVATDLDSGESVAFGGPGHDDVPISTAVRASAALPGMYPPVEIGGRYYVDGALKKTLHASIALRQGARLVLCVNPLVPYDSALARARGAGEGSSLVAGGLPVVLSQTFRAIIHSRMQVGMAKYGAEYRNADVVLFEPGRDDATLFFTNVFSYASRKRLAEHAYRRTRVDLFRRRHEIGPVLARHGIRIRLDVLRDRTRSLFAEAARAAVARAHHGAARIADELGRTLDDLDRWLGERERRRAAGSRVAR
ncbi:MAG: patatin-like phospholipase family protein [Rhodocyclaceae bacterium]